jgi:hypothetical protein
MVVEVRAERRGDGMVTPLGVERVCKEPLFLLAGSDMSPNRLPSVAASIMEE